MSAELERSFEAAVVAEPGEPTHCLAYADWLDERGRDGEAFALRWMARHGRRPHHRLVYRPTWGNVVGNAVPAAYSWGWYRARPLGQDPPRQNPEAPACAYLPRTVFAALTSSDHVYCASWRAAVLLLAGALREAREDLTL